MVRRLTYPLTPPLHRVLWIALLMSLCSAVSKAQQPSQLLLNGDFEKIVSPPDRWSKSQDDFNGILENWTSPTQGSPDVYHPKIDIPKYWRDQGFGGMSPIKGQSYVGITVYGCKGGKPHCREYLQAPLSEPLVPGQKYALTMHTSPLAKGLRIAELGLAVSYEFIDEMTHEVLDLDPIAEVANVIETQPGQWAIVKLLFQAKARQRYLILGNFNDDQHTTTRKDPVHTQHGFAYYYVDELELTKIPPIITYADTTNTYIGRSYEIDEPVVLEHVYFDHDKSTFRPASYQTLAHLLELLQKYPTMIIHLEGHTDTDGSHAYNLRLANRRATAVYDYLIEQGIARSRLSYKGYGETQPIADNVTKEGKAKNRRVAFAVKSF